MGTVTGHLDGFFQCIGATRSGIFDDNGGIVLTGDVLIISFDGAVCHCVGFQFDGSGSVDF